MSFDPERITFFAQTDARGKNVPFGIKAKDRTKHMYVIGKTGMGKSTMLENMVVQDIQNGEGMAFMDPHGASAEKILEYIPEHRMKDVLYFAPFDLENPISFNVMEDVGYDKRHLVVSGLMSTFKKIFVDAWSARMEYILSNTMLALLEFPGATLLGVNRMLSDKNYRDMIVANVKDPAVRSFWVDEFAKYNERYMQEAGDAIKNKIGQFTANPLIRNIIGQEKSSFDVRQMMDDQKILIINLSKGLVGETNANLLGSMFITRIYLAAMSRADMPPAQMAKAPNFYLYVDEFQSFANETFANILSEARKYKLNLTIAHQYVEQMEEEVRNAVFGNVGTTISFRVGPFDAETLEVVFAPQFTATDLVNLGFAQIYLTLMIDGIGSKPFSAVTLPPIPNANISHMDQVIASSREKYAKPRKEIEELIRAWHEPIKKPEKPRAPEGEAAKPAMPDKARVVATAALNADRQTPFAPRLPPRDATPRPASQPGRQEARAGEGRREERRDNGRDGRDGRGDSRPKTEGDRPLPQKPKVNNNLEDLRSVLKNIAQKETPKEEVKDVKKVPEKKEITEASTDALRAALRAAMPVVEKVPEQKVVAETPRPAPAERVVQPPSPVTVAPNVEPVPHAPAIEKMNADEPKGITREELEKMLKVSKHERPPI